MNFSNETVMRFADGELDAETSERIETALEHDEELARRVAIYMETRVLAQTAFQPLLEEPVPDALSNSVQAMVDRTASPAQPVSFPARAVSRRLFAPANDWVRLAAAASLAAVLGAAAGYFVAGDSEHGTALEIAGVDSGSLATLLRSVASGQEAQLDGGKGRFRAIATFRDSTQSLCREFEIDLIGGQTVISVACDTDARWDTRFAVVAPGGDGGYAPASSSEALNAYLTAVEAGPPLSSADEKAALASLQAGE